MRLVNNLSFSLMLASLLMFAGGCPTESKPTSDGDTPAADGKGGGHAHSHDDSGPAGGHLIEIGDEEYHAEWLHDDEEGLLTFIVRDADAKEEVPITAESLTIEMTTTGDDGKEQTQTVEIPAAGRTDDNPKTARFELADKAALFNIVENEKVTSVLLITIEGVAYTSEIEHHAHGHGHSHGH